MEDYLRDDNDALATNPGQYDLCRGDPKAFGGGVHWFVHGPAWVLRDRAIRSNVGRVRVGVACIFSPKTAVRFRHDAMLLGKLQKFLVLCIVVWTESDLGDG